MTGSSGVARFIGVVVRVHWGAPFGSSVVGFIGVRSKGRRVSLGSLGCAAGFIEVRPEDGLGHPGSLRSLGCALGVVGFVRCHWAALWWSSGSSGLSGFTAVCPWGLWGRPGSLVSLGCAIGVDGLICVRWIVWGAPWGSSGSSGVASFIGVCTGGCRVRPG